MRCKVRSPLVWVGGKARLLDWLLPLLEVSCRVYCEPFGGSAAVLLNRPRVPVEIYNDLDGNLVNLLRCVAAHPDELKRQLEAVPYAREVFQQEAAWLRGGQPGNLTDIQRAARFWWLNLASFGGLVYQSGFGTTPMESRPEVTRRHIQTIGEASARLRDVLIEHEDFKVVIKRYDQADALFYCDPPYVEHEQLYGGDGGGFGMQDHRELAALLNSIKGKAAVSYYPCELLDELYPAPHWRRETKQWHSVLTNTVAAPGAEFARTELLLLNYDAPGQQSLFPCT